MSPDLTDDKSTLVNFAVRQQAITWTNVDPDVCRHLVSLGHNELIKHFITNIECYHKIVAFSVKDMRVYMEYNCSKCRK